MHSENDLLLELTGRPIARNVETLYVIGASRFEEQELLFRLFPGLAHAYVFEPVEELFLALRERFSSHPRIEVFPYAISDFDGRADFFVTSDQASSCLLPLGRHQDLFPDVGPERTVRVESRRLETTIADHGLQPADMLFLDVPGAEYKILSSLSSALRSRVSLIYTGASTEEPYVGGRTLYELRTVLGAEFSFAGYAPLTDATPTHGKALFVNHRAERLLRSPAGEAAAPGPA